jgi:hypothetical protein
LKTVSGAYSIHGEIPLRNRAAASVIYVLQCVFPESSRLENARQWNVRAITRKLRTRGRTIEIERRKDLGEREFVREYLNRGLPVIFDGQAAGWGCTRKWNLDFLREEYGDRKLSLYDSQGLVERTHDQTEGKEVPVITEELSAREFVEGVRKGSGAYMRFSPLMETERRLVEDFDGPWLKKMRRTFFGVGYQTFIGAAGRITPIHTDTTAFFYVMANGEKKWTLFSASSSAMINPRPSSRVYNFSDLEIRKPDLAKFPGFDLVSRYECTLRKGDVLFVPTWMWHEVENLSESWGVAYRFASIRGFLRYPALAFVRLFLTQPSFFKIFWALMIARTSSKARTSALTPQVFSD